MGSVDDTAEERISELEDNVSRNISNEKQREIRSEKKPQKPRTMGQGHPWWSSGEESTLQCRGCRFDPWLGN